MRSDDAKRIINEWSQDDDKIIYTNHVLERMEQRGLTRADVKRVLLTGHVSTQPKKDELGNWVAIIEREISGGRDAGVVTAMMNEDEKLVLITVEWMDIK
ncbi:MAG: DUF4258 domain-containing protein [Rhodospirillales bacterium]|nr:DUF4258 domain-containing protein [Rhodospirillales bacterium]